MHACVCTVHTVPRVFTVAHKRCSYSVDTVLQTVARSRFSPSNADTVGNASSFGSLSPFPGTMSCRRVWSSAVAHPCHHTNARTLPFCHLTHAGTRQGAADATSVCEYPLSAGGGYQVRHCIVQYLSGTNAYSTTAPRPRVHCLSHGTGVVARA